MRAGFGIAAALLALASLGSAAAESGQGGATREAELRATETAFAATMADRDLEAFGRFLADEAVFFSGDRALRGKEAVIAAWRPLYEAEVAPFSWKPEVVAVLESGGLGLTSGPVLDASGRRVGTFQSMWRRNADGSWSIVFDRGCDWCGDREK